MTCAAAIALLAAGCSNDTPLSAPDEEENNRMTFQVVHPATQQASATTRVTDTGFEADDRIGLFLTEAGTPLELSGNYVNNALLAFDADNNRWKPTKEIYWNEGTYDVYSYYPYVETPTSVDDLPFSVALDQNVPATDSEPGAYEASDFLWAKTAGVSATDGEVSLQFGHRMSRLLVRLVKGEEYDGDLHEAEVYVHNTVPTATIDLSVGLATRTLYGTPQSIRAKAIGNHRYAAILIPQRVADRVPLIEVVMKGVSYLSEERFVFKPCTQHNVTVVIAKNPSQVKIEIGGEIEGWAE